MVVELMCVVLDDKKKSGGFANCLRVSYVPVLTLEHTSTGMYPVDVQKIRVPVHTGDSLAMFPNPHCAVLQ